jgi:hypothetical protein
MVPELLRERSETDSGNLTPDGADVVDETGNEKYEFPPSKERLDFFPLFFFLLFYILKSNFLMIDGLSTTRN